MRALHTGRDVPKSVEKIFKDLSEIRSKLFGLQVLAHDLAQYKLASSKMSDTADRIARLQKDLKQLLTDHDAEGVHVEHNRFVEAHPQWRELGD
jgi:hypothetical protein